MPGVCLAVLHCAQHQTQRVKSAFFVDPDIQGRGIGRLLWTTIFRLVHQLGLRSLRLDADPNVVGFYVKQGVVEIGMSPSGRIVGRSLPKILLTL